MTEVKLRDIATRVGVSISTVSRVLNSQFDPRFASGTQKQILETAREMGYFNQKLSTLQTTGKPTYAIACMFTSDHESIISPFFSELHKGITMEIKRLSFRYGITFSTINTMEAGFPALLEHTHFDGAVVLGRARHATIAMIRDHVPRLVYAGLNAIEGMDNVTSDIREGIEAIVGHLAAQGYTKIGYIGPTPTQSDVENEYRYQGFVEAMHAHGLAVIPAFVHDSFLHAGDGYAAAMEMLKASPFPEAIICGNDNLAIGVMKALNTRHLNIALAGYDNIPDSAYLTPSLTTVDVPKQDLGRYAVDVLLDALESKRNYPIVLKLPFSLVIRESTRKVQR